MLESIRDLFNTDTPFLESLQSVAAAFWNLFTAELFKLGDVPFTFATLIKVLLVLFAVYLFSRYLRKLLKNRVLPKTKLDEATRFTVLRILHYIIMIVGVLVALGSVGVSFTSLAVFGGLVGVGIGFGLQNITSNFIAGLILLFERPIKVGDRITVGDINGDVDSIHMRATTIITADNIVMIVPNAEFIEKSVINWSYGDTKIRLHVPVGVAYGSDTELVTNCLMETAASHPFVMDDPEPKVWFKEFGDSSLNFELLVWIPDPTERWNTISQLNYKIDRIFREKDIEIPFPQRDLHVRSGLPASPA